MIGLDSDAGHVVIDTDLKHGDVRHLLIDNDLKHGDARHVVIDTDLKHGDAGHVVIDTDLKHGDARHVVLDTDLKHSDARHFFIDTDLKHGENIHHSDSEYVHVALIVTNYIDPDTGKVNKKLSLHLANLLESILTFSTGQPLHFIIITDARSGDNIGQVGTVYIIFMCARQF